MSEGRCVYVVALGCPKNVCDTEVIVGGLIGRGWTLTDDPEYADLYLVNTCAFLPEARVEALQEISAAAEWKRAAAGRLVAVAGCLSEYPRESIADVVAEREACEQILGEVDFWIGVDDIALVDDIVSGRRGRSNTRCYIDEENGAKLTLTWPHYVYIKIADGCDNCCSYCVIPKLRGRLRSRSIASVVAEARQKISGGAREIALVAQDITVFGQDRPKSGENFAKLLYALDAIPGDFSIRLLYTHPAHYTDETIRAMASCRKVLRYVDIPLQHISDRILREQNRHVTKARIVELVGQLRAAMPDVTLRTTFITGLPGESEAEFEELRDFCRKAKFDRIGVFAYSPEPGTRAAAMPGQVPEEIRNRRRDILLKAFNARMARTMRRAVGQTARVMIDSVDGDVAFGHLPSDAPDIDYGTVVACNPRKVSPGDVIDVRIVGFSRRTVVAEPVSPGLRKRK